VLKTIGCAPGVCLCFEPRITGDSEKNSEPRSGSRPFRDFAIVNLGPLPFEHRCFALRLALYRARAVRYSIANKRRNNLGKPYQNELQALSETYGWVRTLDLRAIHSAFEPLSEEPLVVIGSGGSLSAAHLAATLHERRFGHIARPLTPLEFREAAPYLSAPYSALILSAGGRNPDVLSALKTCIEFETSRVAVLCGAAKTPLARMAAGQEFVRVAEFRMPFGKDGFLAVNSLLAFAVILSRVFCSDDAQPLPQALAGLLGTADLQDFLDTSTEGNLERVLERETMIVLYGLDTKSAAVDLESKFTESALGRIQLSDFRNFGHGRHHWLAKRNRESAVLALCSPGDMMLAKKTLSFLPKNVPRMIANFPQAFPDRSIASIVYAMTLTGTVGRIRGIDPGRPGVPEFGRRIYHLKATGKDWLVGEPSMAGPLRRKFATLGFSSKTAATLRDLSAAMNRQICDLSSRKFKALVLDYDGTVCTAAQRFHGPGEAISEQLSRLLASDVVLGIATGRGDSVRKDLRRVLAEKHWQGLWIGYHNGSEIGRLDNDKVPPSQFELANELRPIRIQLEKDEFIRSVIDLRFSQSQITLRPRHAISVHATLELALSSIKSAGAVGVRAVSSTHSVDIIAPRISKMKLLDHFVDSHVVGSIDEILCIGDRGRFPGNDYELLSHTFALSVDEVSADASSGWNLAPPGWRGVAATLFYLAHVKLHSDSFSLSLLGTRHP
jgi:hydroxymethylpyrimidine pyrophosphatase-like HAD family hydrolase